MASAQNNPTSFSGTITSGGVAQQAVAASSDRNWLYIQNVSDTTMYVGFGVVALASQPSIQLAAGASITFVRTTFMPTGAISVIGATTGKGFTILIA